MKKLSAKSLDSRKTAGHERYLRVVTVLGLLVVPALSYAGVSACLELFGGAGSDAVLARVPVVPGSVESMSPLSRKEIITRRNELLEARRRVQAEAGPEAREELARIDRELFVLEVRKSFSSYHSTRFLKPGEVIAVREAIARGEPDGLAYARVGYKVRENAGDDVFGSLESPDLLELSRNIRAIYDEQGAPESERVYPAVVIDSSSGGSPRFPLVTAFEPIPDVEGKVVESRNSDIGAREFYGAFLKGKMGITATTHDSGHVVSLASNRSYRRAMLEIIDVFLRHEPSEWRSKWLYFFFELFSLPDAARKDEIRKALRFPGFGEKPSRFEDVREFFERMPEDELWTHAAALAESYDRLFSHFGGSVANPGERKDWFEGKGHYINRLHMLATGQPAGRARLMQPYDHYSQNGWDLLQALPMRGKLDSREARTLFDDLDMTPEKLRRLVAESAARMEYGLWEGTRFEEGQLIRDVFSGKPEPTKAFLDWMRIVTTEHSMLYQTLAKLPPASAERP